MIKKGLAFALILATLIFCFFGIVNLPGIVDEKVHYNQVLKFINGKTSPIQIPEIPGYHFLLAIVAKLTQTYSMQGVRIISFTVCISTIPIFYCVSNKKDRESALLKTIQFSFFPILFPFFFLIYTDVLSLAFVLLSFLFLLNRKYAFSGLLIFLALFIRQTNIIWLLFFAIYGYYQENDKISYEKIKKFSKKAFFFIIGILFFITFVITNHGFAIGEKDMNQNSSIHFGNIYLLLFLCFFLFFPHHLSQIKLILRKLKENKSLIFIMLLFFIIYLLTFKVDHPYNLAWTNYFLHNKLLNLAISSIFSKIIFFIPIALATLSLIVTKLESKKDYLLYPAAFLSILPVWVIEQRYYLVFFTFFIIFKKPSSKKVEYLTTCMYIITSIFLWYGIKKFWFFL